MGDVKIDRTTLESLMSEALAWISENCRLHGLERDAQFSCPDDKTDVRPWSLTKSILMLEDLGYLRHQLIESVSAL